MHLAERIGRGMKNYGKTHCRKIGGKTDAKDMWKAVRKLTGRRQDAEAVEGVTAELLNDQFAAILLKRGLTATPSVFGVCVLTAFRSSIVRVHALMSTRLPSIVVVSRSYLLPAFGLVRATSAYDHQHLNYSSFPVCRRS